LDERLLPASSTHQDEIDLVALDEALDRLAALDQRQAKVVELRYFGGLGVEEVAAALEISPATVKRDWTLARAWLKRELG
jgi:RNA polymerase sigma factor (TIGR02999 family)